MPRLTGIARRRLLAAASLALVAGAVAWGVARVWPVDTAPFTKTVASGMLLDRDGAPLYAFLNADESWSFPMGLDAISPRMVAATLAVEDQRFRSHPGVDPIAAGRAVLQNLRGQRVSSGASTLTMQIARLGGEYKRSIAFKVWQAWTALRLEGALSKDEILAAYLNKAPYGLNLVGVEAAAQRYFGKPARELTLPEAALLAGLPKAPSAYEPLSHPKVAKARRDHVLARMRDEGVISEAECREAQAQSLGVAWHDFPQHVPHLAMRERARLAKGGQLRTTLDADVQAMVESTAAKYLRRFDNEITNAAVMVVDPATCEVIARVGSAGFFSSKEGRQVDICTAPRSPGSTLKPFTYGLAMQRGMLYPTEKMLDDTLDFGQYSPTNFDGIYNGLISAGDALQMSLNVPAVALLERVGIAPMYSWLQSAGFTTLNETPEHYGLGLTLGNCGVRLDELAAAYCMLANLGEYRPLRELAETPEAAPARLFDRGVALALYRMLEHPFPKENSKEFVGSSGVKTRVCWKTGTSTGFHDAWTVAFNRQYVVAVWVGNSDGRASQRLIGAVAALPLAAAVFRALEPTAAPEWPDARGDEHRVPVCALTGLPATEWCPRQESAVLPACLFLNRRCDVHYPGAEGGGVVERWPGDARAWDLARVTQPVAVSPDGPGASVSRRQQLRITAPAAESRFVFTGEPGGDQVLLQSSLDGMAPVHWYLDGRFLGTSGPESPLYLALAPGEHHLSCLGDAGTADAVRFEVLPAESAEAPAAPARS